MRSRRSTRGLASPKAATGCARTARERSRPSASRRSRTPPAASTARQSGTKQTGAPDGRSPSIATALAAPHRPVDFAFCVAFGDRLPLVVLPLSSRQAKLDLGVVAREVHPQRDERVALLTHLADEARDLLSVEQQLARVHGLVVHSVALRVLGYVHVLKPRLVAIDAHETIAQVRPAVAHGLDLRAAEHDSGLHLFVDEVVVIGAAVDGDVSSELLLFLRHCPRPASP